MISLWSNSYMVIIMPGRCEFICVLVVCVDLDVRALKGAYSKWSLTIIKRENIAAPASMQLLILSSLQIMKLAPVVILLVLNVMFPPARVESRHVISLSDECIFTCLDECKRRFDAESKYTGGKKSQEELDACYEVCDQKQPC